MILLGQLLVREASVDRLVTISTGVKSIPATLRLRDQVVLGLPLRSKSSGAERTNELIGVGRTKDGLVEEGIPETEGVHDSTHRRYVQA